MVLSGKKRGEGALVWHVTSITVLCLAFGCSQPAPAERSPSAPGEAQPSTPHEPPPPTVSENHAAEEGPASEPLKDQSTPVLFPNGVFPPPDPGAPFERSKQDGDGVFRNVFDESPDLPLGKRVEGQPSAGFGEAIVRRLVIHPHEASRFVKLTVAAFDLRKLSLSHVPGSQDVLDVNHPELSPSAGLVPEDQRSAVFSVFNGGFQPRHGRWGMLSLGEQLIPPRDDACTMAVLSDGTARIGSWPRLKGDENVRAYRQTPPCLVEDGEVHPKLLAVDRRPWAGQQKDRKTRRRSAVGVSKDGRTLFYALGSETEPEVLAAGMKHIGAHSAAQLDINWNWTRLFFFEEEDGEVKPVGALEEHMAKDKGEYIYRPGKRGFFYLVRRAQH